MPTEAEAINEFDQSDFQGNVLVGTRGRHHDWHRRLRAASLDGGILDESIAQHAWPCLGQCKFHLGLALGRILYRFDRGPSSEIVVLAPVPKKEESLRMKYLLFTTALFLPLLLLTGCKTSTASSSPAGTDNPEWAKEFSQLGVDGTFVLYDPSSGKWQFHNRERAARAFLPASTFKIFNSLVGLQTKAVANDSVLFKWDGKVRGWEKWDMDQTMKTAFQYSCVWYYQELARRIGTEKMQHWLDKVGYGNAQIGNKVDEFWLDGTLTISAIAQVAFLTKLEAMKLPFSKSVQANVHRLMLAEEGQDWKLYGKTGWGDHGNRQIGWYVGFLRSGTAKRIFALNMDIHEDEDAEYRKVLSRKILKAEGLMPGAE